LTHENSKKKILVAASPIEVNDDLTKSNVFDEVLFCGVGVHAATTFAAQNISVIQDCVVTLAGSCGVFGEFLQPELFSITSVAWRPQSYRRGASRMLDADLQTFKLAQDYAELASAHCVCASALSFDARTEKGAFGQVSSVYVENMELYSLARVWLPKVHSFSAILGSTNAIDPGVHSNWKQNFAHVRDLSSAYLLSR